MEKKTPRPASVAEFCKRFGLGKTKTYEELNSGRLPSLKVGRRRIITEADIESWQARLRAEAAA